MIILPFMHIGIQMAFRGSARRDGECQWPSELTHLWPTDVDANRQLLPEFEAVIMEEADHFLHMAKPEAFNRELERVIGTPP
ncbi:alpha/beta fold hydrolase [Halomonas sp. A11-A]|jgi:pimeloyl-ACP methyl ester carboxylesterase|uniref:alpha/beta fold hydrolase n=1 Tax=Halomonas sp. A11-A TaxID=2183985 RepID=UPI000D70FF50|nr:hypothetical protein [Halomonas sp. A11-A]PWV68840.1 hypothetical protein DER72_1356 [Halomonas sp. A11-A]